MSSQLYSVCHYTSRLPSTQNAMCIKKSDPCAVLCSAHFGHNKPKVHRGKLLTWTIFLPGNIGLLILEWKVFSWGIWFWNHYSDSGSSAWLMLWLALKGLRMGKVTCCTCSLVIGWAHTAGLTSFPFMSCISEVEVKIHCVCKLLYDFTLITAWTGHLDFLCFTLLMSFGRFSYLGVPRWLQIIYPLPARWGPVPNF
mgnify:CR=1 FL=1